MDIGSLIFALVIGIVGSLLAVELAIRANRWAQWVTRRAVRLLPAQARGRYAEQWASDIEEILGPVSKLTYSLGLLLAAMRLSEARIRFRSEIEKQKLIPEEVAHCNGCGAVLTERFCQHERLPCPHCGSTARQFSVQVLVAAKAIATAEATVVKAV